MRVDSVTGLMMLHRAREDPDLVYVDAGHSKYHVLGDVGTALECFPGADVVGDDWGPEVEKGVRLALKVAGVRRRVRNDSTCWWLS